MLSLVALVHSPWATPIITNVLLVMRRSMSLTQPAKMMENGQTLFLSVYVCWCIWTLPIASAGRHKNVSPFLCKLFFSTETFFSKLLCQFSLKNLYEYRKLNQGQIFKVEIIWNFSKRIFKTKPFCHTFFIFLRNYCANFNQTWQKQYWVKGIQVC